MSYIYPALGLSDVLCLPAKKKDSSDTTVLSRFRRVAYVEDFYDILTSQVLKNCSTIKPLKPIIASGFVSRGQVDLIDMRHRPDGPYNWIGHYMDHWSKFHALFALQRKIGTEVAWYLATKVFAYLGLPN
ncbi:hypothetical protein EMCRGX_G007251 [Ephydatia muelleri]